MGDYDSAVGAGAAPFDRCCWLPLSSMFPCDLEKGMTATCKRRCLALFRLQAGCDAEVLRRGVAVVEGERWKDGMGGECLTGTKPARPRNTGMARLEKSPVYDQPRRWKRHCSIQFPFKLPGFHWRNIELSQPRVR